ncbi:unnamed protein product [Lota lota]
MHTFPFRGPQDPLDGPSLSRAVVFPKHPAAGGGLFICAVKVARNELRWPNRDMEGDRLERPGESPLTQALHGIADLQVATKAQDSAYVSATVAPTGPQTQAFLCAAQCTNRAPDPGVPGDFRAGAEGPRPLIRCSGSAGRPGHQASAPRRTSMPANCAPKDVPQDDIEAPPRGPRREGTHVTVKRGLLDRLGLAPDGHRQCPVKRTCIGGVRPTANVS